MSVVCRCHVTCLLSLSLSLSYSYWWPEWLCECRVSLSCDMSPLSLTATGGRGGCVSVVCRCHVTCLLSLSYSYWCPEWLCECRVSLSCDMSPLSLSLSLLQLLVAGVAV